MGVNCRLKQLKPDFPFYFEIHTIFYQTTSFGETIALEREINRWCEDNIENDYYFSRHLAKFKTEEDASAFKLRWL